MHCDAEGWIVKSTLRKRLALYRIADLREIEISLRALRYLRETTLISIRSSVAQ